MPKPGRDAGEIAPRLLEAANAFRRDYYDAHKIPHYASVLQERVDKSHSPNVPMSDREVQAGKRIYRAMLMTPRPIWDGVVAIVAEGKSILRFAEETGRDRQVVKGIVIAGLECVAKAYRL